MAVDLSPLITQITACTMLRDGITTLFTGLVNLMANTDPTELAAAVQAKSAELSAALTIGTSHIAVDPHDPLIPSLRKHLELPPRSRFSQKASIDLAFDQVVAAQAVADAAAEAEDEAVEEVNVKP